MAILIVSSFSKWHFTRGTDPIVNGCALQYTLAPSLQNPPSVPVLFTPHNIVFLVEQLADSLAAPLVAPVPAITNPLNVNVLPSAFIRNPLFAAPLSLLKPIVNPNGLYSKLEVLRYIPHPAPLPLIRKPYEQLAVFGLIQAIPLIIPPFKKLTRTFALENFDKLMLKRGLRINADGSTLTFNGLVIAGTGATNGAANESANYSTRNTILWGVNSTGTEGGFYSDGAKVYWRAHPLTMGSVPP
ncbi:MAG: hypothetical protein EZS28_014843 [Streblomastix strix]|uniref:Uncharacterized protein n=1 Tax=Streblomastix strix TaxID=222440 RepID=A0A5J4W4I6_9EUKA|nr:MAG: hypothetical protein EZS28_014843 [Streblomastix strix]